MACSLQRRLPSSSLSRRWFSQLPAQSGTLPDRAAGPLQGIKVLDLTRILAGPWCTMLLGDMGAEVWKIENPKGGDDTRTWGPPFYEKHSAYFICCNRNKQSIALDLKAKEGKEIAVELAKQADVLVENYLPGKLAEFGLSYSELQKLNPRLVYASLSGFGQTGPSSSRAGYDVAIAAQTGLMSITGPEEGEPVKVGVALTDISTGLYLHGAIIASLFHRERTGRGQSVDTSLLEAQVANLANVASTTLLTGRVPKRWGTAHESIAPYQAFPASDGYFIVAAMNDRQFRSLCTAIGLNHLAADPRFSTNPLRVQHRKELIPALQEAFKQKPRQHWIQLLSREDVSVTCAPINSVNEGLTDPQVAARDMLLDVPAPNLGPGKSIRMVGLPVKYSDSPAQIRLPPPLLGEHTASLLKARLGYSEERLQELKRAGVISMMQ